MCPCACHMCAGIPRSQKRMLDALELEVEVVVNCPKWVLGYRLRSSGRAANASNHGAMSPVPYFVDFSTQGGSVEHIAGMRL